MRSPSLGQNTTEAGGMMEVGNRFSDMRLTVIHETSEASSQDARKQQRGGEVKKTAFRAPRRAFSTNEYQLPPSGSSSTPFAFVRSAAGTPSPVAASRPSESDSYFPYKTGAPNFSIPTFAPTASSSSSSSSSAATTPSATSPRQQQEQQQQSIPVAPSVSFSIPAAAEHAVTRIRPILPSPQRSYSVMDYEPIPVLQLPGEKLRLVHLPSELHYAIFDFLDAIDSACLGLTSRHFYAIHRRLHGTVPLSVRREGPNDMEWAWRLAGPLIAAGQSQEKAINSFLRPRGQVYCRKCGITRCELHKHIREWMGPGREYCEVRQRFGSPAPESARKICYRSSPKHPHRCGRHTRQQRTVRLV